jgi:hypothetical protein
MEPSQVAAEIERHAGRLVGPGDRFRGYGVISLSFAGGDVLAMRRFPSTSRATAYTSVWHRTPDGRWTLYADTSGDHGCRRYFAPIVDDTIVTPIRVEWLAERRLSITIDGGRLLSWSIDLAGSARARLLSAVFILPAPCWELDAARRAVEVMIRLALGTGPFRLLGHTPTGHRPPAPAGALARPGQPCARLRS